MNRLTKSQIVELLKELPENGYFLRENSIGLFNIPKLSKTFQSLDLSKEDIVFIYLENKEIQKCNLILTNLFLHYRLKGKPAFSPVAELSLVLANESADYSFNKIDKESLAFLKSIPVKMEQTELKQQGKSQFTDLLGKFKEMLDKDFQTKNPNLDLDEKWLRLLQYEGDKYVQVCDSLNSDPDFNKAVSELLTQGDTLSDDTSYKAEHFFLSDLIKIYKKIETLNQDKKQAKILFALAYMFERLQGKDMAKSLSLERINQLIRNENFESNINKIKESSFFKVGPEYEKEFILVSILSRLQHDLADSVNSHLFRFASILVKSDDEITDEEQKTLEEIKHQLYHPRKKLKGVKQVDVPENETMEQVMAELNGLIGLDNIKKAINDLTNFLKVQKIREEKGLATSKQSLHSVFMGPPGTGKTTIARLLARIYKHLGYLTNGHLVETDRAGMVAGYVGQTAIKVDEIVNSAIGGMLFIDEAYSLATKDGGRDFGNEAVETLLKRMEDQRGEFVVVAAGYPDEMEFFIKSNPGLQSRFNRYFKFDHYKPLELMDIFKLFCAKSDFELNKEGEEKLLEIFERLYEKRNKSFGNARIARNLFEKCIEQQANRIIKITPLDVKILKTLREDDIPEILKTVEELLVFQEKDEE